MLCFFGRVLAFRQYRYARIQAHSWRWVCVFPPCHRFSLLIVFLIKCLLSIQERAHLIHKALYPGYTLLVIALGYVAWFVSSLVSVPLHKQMACLSSHDAARARVALISRHGVLGLPRRCSGQGRVDSVRHNEELCFPRVSSPPAALLCRPRKTMIGTPTLDRSLTTALPIMAVLSLASCRYA